MSTDTRSLERGNLFFALKGPNFNANQLAKEAIEKGASYAVIDDEAYFLGEKTLLVEDGLLALQALARDYRRTLNIPIIALTGSNGKTTTKELIYQVLSKKYRTAATKGNLNNHIGVPLTLLAIKKEIEIAIVEMGANKQGDIKELVEIAEPTHGLITNIGKAHLEGFGGMSGVRKGKGEMFDYLKEHEGKIFIPKKDPILQELVKEKNLQNCIYTTESIKTHLITDTPLIEFKDENGVTYPCHIPGHYNYANMEMAMAVGAYFGVNNQAILQAIADYKPDNHRSQFIFQGSNKILMDSYNANPTSMRLAIESFNQLKEDKKILILGGMNELGEESKNEHAAIGKLIAELPFDLVILAGENFAPALPYLPKAYFFSEKFGLHTWLKDHPIKNSAILIKGSRGMKLESVLSLLDDSISG